MKPHPHQHLCLDQILASNTIVNMPTGTGKTLVAVLAIDNFRKYGKAIFLVPTRSLVSQQANYIRTHSSSPITVAELQGVSMHNASRNEWQTFVNSNDVLVGTAEIFRRALVDTGFLSLEPFRLLIFDECHNATGNNPMAAILRDSVHRSDTQLRILGLTASFVHGSLSNIEKKRQDLEGLFQATIFSPSVDERPVKFERVSYHSVISPAMKDIVESKIQQILQIAENYEVPLSETRNVIRRGIHVFQELGAFAFVYFLGECVAPQVHKMIESASAYRIGNRTRDTLPLQCLMRETASSLTVDRHFLSLPTISNKAEQLLDLTSQLHIKNDRVRMIIFCEQTVLAFPLAHLLRHYLGYKSTVCTGIGAMTDSQRKQALQNFRLGHVSVLVCTAALEEGLDVSECDVVVRFSSFATTKSHIQGSGRARAWNAQVFYFDNDPNQELAGASHMNTIARAAHLTLSDEDLARAREHRGITDIHPFRSSTGAEISIFNGLQLVYEYVAKTMGQSFRPEENILTFEGDKNRDYTEQGHKLLIRVSIPSPEGLLSIELNEVNLWWDDIRLEDIVDPSRIKNWSSSDKELRRFMYVTAIRLSKQGLLDENNQPSALSLRRTRQVCEHWTTNPGVRIRVRYIGEAMTLIFSPICLTYRYIYALMTRVQICSSREDKGGSILHSLAKWEVGTQRN